MGYSLNGWSLKQPKSSWNTFKKSLSINLSLEWSSPSFDLNKRNFEIQRHRSWRTIDSKSFITRGIRGFNPCLPQGAWVWTWFGPTPSEGCAQGEAICLAPWVGFACGMDWRGWLPWQVAGPLPAVGACEGIWPAVIRQGRLGCLARRGLCRSNWLSSRSGPDHSEWVGGLRLRRSIFWASQPRAQGPAFQQWWFFEEGRGARGGPGMPQARSVADGLHSGGRPTPLSQLARRSE